MQDPQTAYSDTGDEAWTGSYNNANFTFLAKVVIPKLRGNGVAADNGIDAVLDNEVPLSQAQIDAYTGTAYMYYVQDDIFAPMGLSNVSLDTDGTPDDDVLAYSSSDPPGANGASMDDLLTVGGAIGWKMSAEELATFLYAVRNDDGFLSPDVRDMMFARGLGWSTGSDPAFGGNFGHRGLQKQGQQSFRSQVGVF